VTCISAIASVLRSLAVPGFTATGRRQAFFWRGLFAAFDLEEGGAVFVEAQAKVALP
jgi:hypothetical protein